MKKILLFFIIIASSILAKAQLTETLHQEQIKLVMKIQEQNWNMGNIEGFMEGYWQSDSLLFIGSKGPTYGWLKTLTNYKQAYPTKDKMGHLTFGFIKIEMIDNQNAFVAGTWQLDRKEDILKGHFTLLWKKIDGEWKIIADHSS